jgi:TorA maturation chaperone TorD
MSSSRTESVQLLAQADLLLLLSEMLSPPTAWPAVAERSFNTSEVDELARLSGLERVTGGVESLSDAVTAWGRTDRLRAVSEHNRLFEGAMACAPNETIVVRRDKGAVLADIAGFYRAFGFEISERFREKHDHVLAELQFTALLLVLLARAIEDGRTEPAEVTRDALRSFLSDHLGVWVGAFAERLEAVSPVPVYVAVARALAAGWLALKQEHQVVVPELAEAVEMDPGTPYECGMCEKSPDDSASACGGRPQ